MSTVTIEQLPTYETEITGEIARISYTARGRVHTASVSRVSGVTPITTGMSKTAARVIARAAKNIFGV